MKSKTLFLLTLIAAALMIGAPITRADSTTPDQQAQIDQLKKTYPLTTCPVSGDDLGKNDMGSKPIDYLYTQTKADGTKTTRLVRFCCKDCLAKFRRNPDKYLKIIDEAQAKKS